MALRDRLDPDLAGALDLVPFDHLDESNVESMRFDFDFPANDAVERVEHTVPGDPAVPVRVYRPRGATGALPCVLSLHGGGYVIGSYAIDDPMLNDLCPALGCAAVSVDYRLAPGTPYPGPLEDCYRALAWVHEQAGALGVDGARVGVMGESAGGGLAAALALLARERGGPPIAFQLLDSPMIDDRQTTWSSRQDGLPVWSRESNAFGWRSYLGALYGRADVAPTAAPARAADLSGLPSAFVAVGALDGFLDEDVDYAMRLAHAGVPTELHVYPGACHGYHIAPGAAVTRQATRDRDDWLARQLRNER